MKKFRPKDLNRRHRDRRLFTLPLCRWRFDITRRSAYHSFAVATDIFNNSFGERRGALGQKKKYVSNEIVSINNKMN